MDTSEGECPRGHAAYPTTSTTTENAQGEPGRVIYGGWRCTDSRCEYSR